MVSVLASLFYFIALIISISGIFFVKKSEKELFGATWLPVSALLLTLYQCLFAGIFTIVHIPVNLVSIGITDLLLGIVFYYYIIKKKCKQKYRFEKVDYIMWIFLFVLVALLAKQRYGFDLHIHYQAIDPAQHLENAYDTMKAQSVNAMYYASFHNGILLSLLAPFRKVTQYYQIYVLGDILHFFLAGLMFYGLIRKNMRDKFMDIAAFPATAIYLFAYPLNSTIFGFTYLGMCVTLVACTLVIADDYISQDLPKWIAIIMLSLCCLGVFECYVLFMPVVFFSLLFCILFQQKKISKIFSFDTIKICLSIFLIPTVLGLYFTYRGIFGSQGNTTVGSAIAQEGGIYKDLFSNFVILLPLTIYGYYYLYKEKKNNFILYLFPILSGFVLSLFGLGMVGQVSSYYFYKTYYLLWLLVFVLAFDGAGRVTKSNRLLLVISLFTWLFAAHMGTLDMELRVEHTNPQFIDNYNSHGFCDIFIFNRDALFNAAYPYEKLELYDHAICDSGDDSTYVPVAGQWEDYYWMEAVTGQRCDDFKYFDNGDQAFFDALQNVNYVTVLYDGQIYASYSDYFDSFEKVYENEYGYVAKVDPNIELPKID